MKKIILFFLFLCQVVIGQNSTVVVFDAQDAEEVNIVSETVLKNAVKWNWSLLSRGVFMLNYERELKPWISLEVGAGLCYRDFIYEGMEDLWMYEGDESSTAIIKPAFETRVRLYPFLLDDMEGFYCSLGYINRNYGLETDWNDVIYESSYKFNESQFLVGWQYESFWIDNILADFYFGIGLRNYKLKTYDEEYINGSSSYLLNEKDGSKPAFYMGWKLTVPF